MVGMKKFASIFIILSFFTLTHCNHGYETLLSGPRFHFSGSFLCDQATVNNKINNFDVTRFVPHHALPETEGGTGGNSPRGTNSFSLADVTVKSVCYSNQTCNKHKQDDEIIGNEIKDNPRSIAKIVDIDPKDPLGGTQIWAMKIVIAGAFSADADVLTMRDMWRRDQSGKGDIDTTLSGQFHGVLMNVQFEDDKSDSELIEQLRAELEKSESKQLSIRFVLDRYRFNHTGRIYGTIGCHGYKAPQSKLFSRALMPVDKSSFGKASFALDEKNKVIVFDFESSFQTNENGTHVMKKSEYYWITYRYNGVIEGILDKTDVKCKENRVILGIVPLWKENWLTENAGFMTVKISANQIDDVKHSSLEIVKVKGEGSNAICQGIVLKEREDGVQIFATGDMVFRKESGDMLNLEFVASKFGLPQSDVEVKIMQYCKAMEKELFCEPKLPLPLVTKTDENGLVKVSIKVPMLKTPRKVMDGQVYKIVYFHNKRDFGIEADEMLELDKHPSVAVKVFDHIEYPSEVTWVDHVYPIFSQYANLFPVMKGKTFDISNYYSVIKMKNTVMMSLNLPINHSNYMPVTRDLSQRKRRMIVDWLSKDKPKMGKVEKLMNIQHLRALLQTALEVEHATIPPYFTALWSIRNGYNRKIHRIIKTVVRQEMLHMGLVANLINAIGGHPSLIHSTFIAKYPTNLPGGLNPDLIVSLEKLSKNVSRDVFMKIEEPDLNFEHQKIRGAIFEHLKATRCQKINAKSQHGKACQKKAFMNNAAKRGCPKIVKKYFKKLSDRVSSDLNSDEADEIDVTKEIFDYKASIAAFYTHLLLTFARLTNCGADESIFTGKRELQLTTDGYHYGNGKMIEVNDYVSAVTAIKMVIEEGEGTSDCDPIVHYFDASDDLSHYKMFETITKGYQIRKKKEKKKFGRLGRNSTHHDCEDAYGFHGPVVRFHPEGIWPIKKNAKESDYKKGSLAYIRSRIFTTLYNRLLGTLHKAFNGEKEYFTNALFLMYAVDYYGRELVKLTIEENGSSFVGPNAAPIFKWIPSDLKEIKINKLSMEKLHKFHLHKKKYKSRKVKGKEAKEKIKTIQNKRKKNTRHKKARNSHQRNRQKWEYNIENRESFNSVENRRPHHSSHVDGNYLRTRDSYYEYSKERQFPNDYRINNKRLEDQRPVYDDEYEIDVDRALDEMLKRMREEDSRDGAYEEEHRDNSNYDEGYQQRGYYRFDDDNNDQHY